MNNDLHICARCRLAKPRGDFNRNPRYRSGLQSYCKQCMRAVSQERRSRPEVRARELAKLRAWRARNRQKVSAQRRRSNLKHLYGLTVEEYEGLLLLQGGGCAICGALRVDKVGRRLAVDHDRTTGEIRGLLCSNCNIGIGHFQHDSALLKAALAYLGNMERDRK